MSYRPVVIHKAKKVESFIERTEPRLIQQLDSWKDLRIDQEEKARAEEIQRIYMQEQSNKSLQMNKPKRLPIRQQILVRNLSSQLGSLVNYSKLEKYAFRLNSRTAARKNTYWT